MAELDASVIVPVRNGARFLPDCLSALERQSVPRARYEVIVVDNGSTDGSIEIARRFRVEVASESTPGPGAARNAGVRHARSKALLFTDADCRPGSSWIARMTASLESAPAAFGGIRPVASARRAARLRAALHGEYLEACAALSRRGELDRLDTANAAVRRIDFVDAGGFPEDVFVGEDRLLGARIAASGKPIRYLPEAIVAHDYDVSLRDGIEKGRAAGIAFVRLRTLVGDRFFAEHFADGLAIVERAVRRSRAALAWRREAHAALAAVAPRFSGALRHYRDATRLATELGVLEAVEGEA